MSDNTSDFKVATIELVSSLTPVEGCDNLMVIEVGLSPLKSLVPKDLFQVGTQCVVIHEGAILPMWAESIGATPAGRFLKRSKYVVRKLNLRGHTSECLVLDISLLKALNPGYVPGMRRVGDEVGDLLGLGFMANMKGKEMAFLPSPIDAEFALGASAPSINQQDL